MYDTIGLFLEDNVFKEGLLENPKEIYNQETGEIISTGKLRNLRVKINGDKVSVIGSLPKFYLGNNLQSLTRNETKNAIEKVSDLLQLPLEESKIFRLDIGASFQVNETLQNYYSCLGNLARFKKSEISNSQTLLYRTTTKALSFYDKTEEMKRSKQEIPDIYNGKNILRYELQLKKRIATSLKLPEVRAKQLYEENFFRKGIDFWKDIYFSIQRINEINFHKEALIMINAKTLKNQLALIGLKAIGEKELLKIIESNKDQIKHRQQVSRMKELVKSLSQEPELTKQNESIKELDTKILETAEYYYC